ncbi:hypothetical protein [Nocardiopsis sp. YSL2]|uniref:hypothetical protein n=1 Tax=Nocardiopsis sp. YSL2 TaxID=2939492 RepID=UPI0026F41FD1|nr:hypothetical protein [Nocardiopsis sp. YSL2]
MPSFEHEFPLDLIRNDPGFAAELLQEVSGKPLPEHTRVCCDAAALGSLEEIMKLRDYEFKTELIGRPFREGEAKGLAESLLVFLEGRGIAVSDEVRTRVTSSADHDELLGWVRRAATVERAEDLFR